MIYISIIEKVKNVSKKCKKQQKQNGWIDNYHLKEDSAVF